MKKEIKKQKPSCSSCGSKLIYIRIKDNERVCRNCGNVEKLKLDKDNGK